MSVKTIASTKLVLHFCENTGKLQREKHPRIFKSLCVSLVLLRFLLDFLWFSTGFLSVQSLCFSVCSRDPESVFLSAVSLVSAMPVPLVRLAAFGPRRGTGACGLGA